MRMSGELTILAGSIAVSVLVNATPDKPPSTAIAAPEVDMFIPIIVGFRRR
jgi:hypothetical protein